MLNQITQVPPAKFALTVRFEIEREPRVTMLSNKIETEGDWPLWRLRKEALKVADDRLSQEPQAIEQRLFRARLLTELGQFEEAKSAYIELLALSPSHFDALNDLGKLLNSSGFTTASRTCFAEAVARHPENPVGHVNLGCFLMKEGELALARRHLEMALQADPNFPEAHQGLAYILLGLGDEEAAERHRVIGFKNRSVDVLPFRGRRMPIPVLVLASAMGGTSPIIHLLDDRLYLVTVMVVEFLDPASPLPPHRLMINAIGDADLCGPGLEGASRLAALTHAPVLNDPAAVLKTERIANASRLSQLPGVIAPAMISLPRAALAQSGALDHLASLGFPCPFLVRTLGFHNGQNFFKIETADELSAALASLPGRDLAVMQFLDARDRDGKIRKYRVMFIDGAIYPLHAAISQDWKVHYVTAEMAGRPEHLVEDEAFLNAMPEVLGPRAMMALESIRDALGLDYGGVDFSVNKEGEILLFEANATMVVPIPGRHEQWEYRRAPVDQILNAVSAMLASKAGAFGGAFLSSAAHVGCEENNFRRSSRDQSSAAGSIRCT